jgi:arsenate reductase
VAERPLNVLFLCTGNSARSIMAEAILSKLGAGKFRAYSAGSQPKGRLHPATLQLLQGLGYDTSGFRSKSWDEFAKGGGPEFDFVFSRPSVARLLQAIAFKPAPPRQPDQ